MGAFGDRGETRILPSGARRAAQLFEGQLAGCLPTALRAVIDVTPRPEKARSLGIQQDDERLRDRVDVEPEVGAPTSGGQVAVEIETLEDAAKAHPFGIEQPGAVTGLQNERFHAWIIAPEGDDQDSTVLRFRDDPRQRNDLSTLC